jgi:ATP-dependent DNA helicase RecG
LENTLRTRENIDCLSGVGVARKALLERLSIRTLGDMLMHIPVRYLDWRTINPISSLGPGTDAVVSGRIVALTGTPGRRGPALRAVLRDDTGSITLTFFKSGFPVSKLRSGMEVIACGRVESYGGFSMVHPELFFTEEAASGSRAPGMLPIYGLAGGLTQGIMRKLAASALDAVRNTLVDILPCEIITKAGFESRWDVFRAAHRPDCPDEGRSSRDLLALEELYLYRSVLSAIREKGSAEPGISVPMISIEEFESALPWPLTPAQKRVCVELCADMSGNFPMRRLVQGDVGSGKTVVAAFACISTALAGKTAAVLAPTEVLAAQHYSSLCKMCMGFGLEVHLLTGGTTGFHRKRIAQRLKENPGCVVIGTHAILEDWVPFSTMALLVIDEQHRFGVAQREKLLASTLPRPNALVMSATPIPRTLAMTFYGDLDLSVIDSLPPGRGETLTQVVYPPGKEAVFRLMMERLAAGERVFLVYPLKEASEKMDLRDAATAYDTVLSGPAAKYGAGLLHGSMPSSEKVAVTEQFSRGEIGVLVSTTVIEVGIDVPEATIMVIANAERFGLSQLHQLRGRVGRGGRNAWCFLVPGDGASEESKERLQILTSTSDGFVIAEMDLKIRGPGQVLGTAQHGMPGFMIADLSTDQHLLRIVSELQPIPLTEVHQLLKYQMWRYCGMELPGV